MEEDAYITSVIDSHRVAFTLNQEVYRADFTIIGDGSTSNTTSCASYNCVKKKKKERKKTTLECTTPACTNKGPQAHCILAQLLSSNVSSRVVTDRSKAQTQYRLVGRADENSVLLHVALAPWKRGKAQVYRKTKAKVVFGVRAGERRGWHQREGEFSDSKAAKKGGWVLTPALWSLSALFIQQSSCCWARFWVGILKSIVLRWNTVTSLRFFSSLLSCNGIHSCGLEN